MSGISGFITGGASMLSNDLITKLKDGETSSRLSPITSQLNKLELNKTESSSLKSLINNLKNSSNLFNFNNSKNSFKEMSASTQGNSVLFDVVDFNKLKEEEINVSVSQLAKKDVKQSNIFTDKNTLLSNGNINLNINGKTVDIDTTNKTMEQISSEINNSNIGVNSSIEEVSSGKFRLILKSSNPGFDNAINITQTNINIGLNDTNNYVQTASNLIATIDGTDYNVASNSINLSNGLRITPVSIGDSSIKLEKNKNIVLDNFKSFVSDYNTFVSGIKSMQEETSNISDKSTFTNVLKNIKNELFNKSDIFSMGVSFNQYGEIQLDEEKFNSSLENNYTKVLNLLTGNSDSNLGFISKIYNYIENITSDKGFLTSYSNNLNKKETLLNEEKTNMLSSIEKKYLSLNSQFTEYSKIINSFESSFAGLKQMISLQSSNN